MPQGTFPATFPFFFHVPQTYRHPYLLEVRDADGNLVRFLTKWFGAEVTQKLNEPSEFTFTVSASEDSASALNGRNEIWVRSQDDSLLDRFVLSQRTERNSAQGPMIEILALSQLADLADEPITDYDEEDTIANHLSSPFGWFAGQIGAHPISLGAIDSSISTETRAIEVKDSSSILSQVRLLADSLPFESMFWVDVDREFRWVELDGSTNTGVQLLIGKNLRRLERRVDFGKQITRVYAYGSNEGGKRVKLSDADGQSEDYIDADYSAWSYHKQIVIDHLLIDARGEANYELAFVQDADADFAEHMTFLKTNPRIVFLSATNTLLSHVLNSYDEETGAIDATVTIPRVSGVKDTVLYILFGI